MESPTAALEYARRLAQRGVPANALVRAYRIVHKVVLGMMVEGIYQVDADPTLGLDVFGRIAAVSFRYIDWISQQVVEVYEANRTGGWKTAAASVTSELPRFSKAVTSTSTR